LVSLEEQITTIITICNDYISTKYDIQLDSANKSMGLFIK
jgi:hypothetical protein